MRGALDDRVVEIYRFYIVPASNTAVGHIILENRLHRAKRGRKRNGLPKGQRPMPVKKRRAAAKPKAEILVHDVNMALLSAARRQHPRSTRFMQLNGIAHIYLTVSDFERCLPFYEKLLEFFDMRCLVKTDVLFYCVGSRTGIGIRKAKPEYADVKFDQGRSGVHHLCFRARSREDVDTVYEFVRDLGARIIHAPEQEDDWAPGYYSVLFEDPEGIRLEVNYVPGKGNLDPSITLPLSKNSQTRLSD